MATLGQPEEDLAWFLLLDRHHSEGVWRGTAGRASPIRRRQSTRYQQLTGQTLAHMDYYEVLSAMKFAVVMAQDRSAIHPLRAGAAGQ